MMKGKWLLDTGPGLTCMSSQQFRVIPIKKRLGKFNLNQRETRCASGMDLISDGDHLEWNGKKLMQPVTVFRDLSSLLILGIDAMDNLGITYLIKSKKLLV
jgi:hypothetical protein